MEGKKEGRNRKPLNRMQVWLRGIAFLFLVAAISIVAFQLLSGCATRNGVEQGASAISLESGSDAKSTNVDESDGYAANMAPEASGGAGMRESESYKLPSFES